MVYERFIEHHMKMIRLGEFLMTLSHVILLVVNERTVEHDVKIIRCAEFVVLHLGRKDVFVG